MGPVDPVAGLQGSWFEVVSRIAVWHTRMPVPYAFTLPGCVTGLRAQATRQSGLRSRSSFLPSR